MRQFTFLLFLITAAHTLSGCTNTVSGSVDGIDLPALQSVFFIESENGYGDDGTILVWMSSVPDACQTTGAVLAGQNATDDPDALAALWAENYPDDFWEVTVVLRTADINVPLAGASLDGTPWNAEAQRSGEAFVNLTHSLAQHDASFWDESEEYSRYEDLYYSDGGTLKVDVHEPGKRIRGSFETVAADWDDGDAQGDITVRFDAERCLNVERAYF